SPSARPPPHPRPPLFPYTPLFRSPPQPPPPQPPPPEAARSSRPRFPRLRRFVIPLVLVVALAAAAFLIWKLYFAKRGVPESIVRSEEHTSELQSLTNLVCRLLLVT